MGFGEAFKHNLIKPFEGRASRSEYWWFVLWYFLLFLVPYFIVIGLAVGVRSAAPGDANLEGMEMFFAGAGIILFPLLFAWIFLLYWMIIAMACTMMRRLHDTDRSAWWFLIVMIPLVGPIVLLVFLCLPGTTGPNRFGEDPLQPVDATVFR